MFPLHRQKLRLSPMAWSGKLNCGHTLHVGRQKQEEGEALGEYETEAMQRSKIRVQQGLDGFSVREGMVSKTLKNSISEVVPFPPCAVFSRSRQEESFHHEMEHSVVLNAHGSTAGESSPFQEEEEEKGAESKNKRKKKSGEGRGGSGDSADLHVQRQSDASFEAQRCQQKGEKPYGLFSKSRGGASLIFHENNGDDEWVNKSHSAPCGVSSMKSNISMLAPTPGMHSLTLSGRRSLNSISFREMTSEQQQGLGQVQQHEPRLHNSTIVSSTSTERSEMVVVVLQPVVSASSMDFLTTPCVSPTLSPPAPALMHHESFVSVTVSPLSQPIPSWHGSPHSAYLQRYGSPGFPRTPSPSPSPLVPQHVQQSQAIWSLSPNRCSSQDDQLYSYPLNSSSSLHDMSFNYTSKSSQGPFASHHPFFHPQTPRPSFPRKVGSSSDLTIADSYSGEFSVPNLNDEGNLDEIVCISPSPVRSVVLRSEATAPEKRKSPADGLQPDPTAQVSPTRFPPFLIMRRPPTVPKEEVSRYDLASGEDARLETGSLSPLSDTEFFSDCGDSNKYIDEGDDEGTPLLFRHCSRRLFGPPTTRWRSSRRGSSRSAPKFKKQAEGGMWDMLSRLEELEKIRVTNFEALEEREQYSTAASDAEISPMRGVRGCSSPNRRRRREEAWVSADAQTAADETKDVACIPHGVYNGSNSVDESEICFSAQKQRKMEETEGNLQMETSPSPSTKSTPTQMKYKVMPLNVNRLLQEVQLKYEDSDDVKKRNKCNGSDGGNHEACSLDHSLRRITPKSLSKQRVDKKGDDDCSDTPRFRRSTTNSSGCDSSRSCSSNLFSFGERRCLRVKTPSSPRVLLKHTPRFTTLPCQHLNLASLVHKRWVRQRYDAMVKLVLSSGLLKDDQKGEGLLAPEREADAKDDTHNSHRRRKVVIIKRRRTLTPGVTRNCGGVHISAGGASSSPKGGSAAPSTASLTSRERKVGDEAGRQLSPLSRRAVTTAGMSAGVTSMMPPSGVVYAAEKHASLGRAAHVSGKTPERPFFSSPTSHRRTDKLLQPSSPTRLKRRGSGQGIGGGSSMISGQPFSLARPFSCSQGPVFPLISQHSWTSNSSPSYADVRLRESRRGGGVPFFTSDDPNEAMHPVCSNSGSPFMRERKQQLRQKQQQQQQQLCESSRSTCGSTPPRVCQTYFSADLSGATAPQHTQWGLNGKRHELAQRNRLNSVDCPTVAHQRFFSSDITPMTAEASSVGKGRNSRRQCGVKDDRCASPKAVAGAGKALPSRAAVGETASSDTSKKKTTNMAKKLSLPVKATTTAATPLSAMAPPVLVNKGAGRLSAPSKFARVKSLTSISSITASVEPSRVDTWHSDKRRASSASGSRRGVVRNTSSPHI